MSIDVGYEPLSKVYVGTETVNGIYTGNKKVWDTEGIYRGTVINMDIDGTARNWRVLETNEARTSVKLMGLFYVSTLKFRTNTSSGNSYTSGTLDTGLNTTWYGTLSAEVQAWLQSQTFYQTNYLKSTSRFDENSIICKKKDGTTYYLSYIAQYTKVSSKKIRDVTVHEVLDYLEAKADMSAENTTITYTNLLKMLYNSTATTSETLWICSSSASANAYNIYLDCATGEFTSGATNVARGYRPVIVVDLANPVVNYTIVSQG